MLDATSAVDGDAVIDLGGGESVVLFNAQGRRPRYLGS
jgi:hypothetical protein